MPRPLNRTDRRLLAATAIALTLLIAAALFFGSENSGAGTPTTYSSGSAGFKAAYLLLERLDYQVSRWERSPEDLADPEGTTLVLASPFIYIDGDNRAALQRFVRDGGRLIAMGRQASWVLPNQDVSTGSSGTVSWEKYRAFSPSRSGMAAPEITLAAESRWTSHSEVIALYGDSEGAVVVKYRYGSGEIVWWAGATPLSNAGIREPGNLELVLETLGDPGDTEVLFDEYFHGYRESLSGTVVNSPWKWLLAQLVVFAGAILLTFSRRSGPVRPHVAESRLSPLEFVSTLAGLYQRANATSVAVDVAYQRFRYRLTRRLGLAFTTPVEQLQKAVAERWRHRDPEFGRVLQQCESARFATDLPRRDALRLVQALHRYNKDFKLDTNSQP